MCVSLRTYVSSYIYFSVCVSLHIWLFLYVSLYIYIPLYICFFIYVSLYICLKKHDCKRYTDEKDFGTAKRKINCKQLSMILVGKSWI